MTLAENLELENQALLRRDRRSCGASTTAIAWIEMQGRLGDAVDVGTTPIPHYDFDSIACRC